MSCESSFHCIQRLQAGGEHPGIHLQVRKACDQGWGHAGAQAKEMRSRLNQQENEKTPERPVKYSELPW